MELNQIYNNAREKMKGYCKVCPFCDGKACRGEVPGMGGAGTGSAFQANIEAWQRYKLEMRTIHQAQNPNTELELFGVKLTTPILKAPVTGSSYNMGGSLSEEEYADIVVQGSKEFGTIAMTGDGADPTMYNSGLKAIKQADGFGIAIIKPRSQKEIIKRIKEAEKAGALAVGVDIDGAGLITMALKGQPVGPKSKEEIEELVNSTDLPFILKGIMTLDEARIAAEAGVDAIVVSNHGGRVLDSTPGTADVLAEIVSEVGERIKILVDGGIRSGVDVLKALALGANGVLVARPLIIGVFGGEKEGFKMILDKMTTELKKAMILTGCESLGAVKGNILRKVNY
ncbi:alpha-hydroxy-acid oxidizing enzyme [Orenia metallireducens]|jgi:isopentenyl diphosphate isomerase/L-lactate dehydrogenase-like FMN-dependent dehydrogenase|uniref:L-lactate oxidase n=1 Tax=Orenia metallireducens TaxID=1413210 RepID=A0A1C0A5N7_9FIRM|nr:alpha-hydroxy-acid oxidizing protein [Orenia metallireducens]OCL25429.1 alpha-hydroxy-acid oxidizing enzyme [Orenia metallireducens]